MIENKIEFYHSKVMLFLGIIASLLIVTFGTIMMYKFVLLFNEYMVETIIVFPFFMLFTVVSGFFGGANILKMVRGYPYVTITEEYIQLDSFTKSEVTIYFTDIEYIKVSEASFQKNH